ncbi:ABC transporter substrate-binding protein [Mycobacterium yunnanensis]|uniref:ABC transporter substrate-binding protein n=1 Tax=Mycobacterium yunnanensis TaxID=368477 RepID=A0A9X3C3P4_9MYCO|nr:ABC transporter substrate-binding protein [Mycobacterium yunnanensis]MCV7424733.1 ABC transporter substrate-binding protein [Mycobacterium yunnanensis]
MPKDTKPLTTAAQGHDGWDRRSFLKAGGLTVGGLGLASLIAACGAGDGSGPSNSGTLTLRMPFMADMQVPDPDIFYEAEGLQLTNATYEGLAKYQPGTATIVPNLATGWTISPDFLTYTFQLRPGVKFHDGTAVDAEAWQKSFERRKVVEGGPGYMVKGVASTAAPNPTTFVVTLTEPNNAFIHYLACPFKPAAVSPTALSANAIGDDHAQQWLTTHDAGTGPYTIKEFVTGSHYTLEAFPDYWGDKPTFQTVRIEVTPSIANQKLQLDGGGLDLATKGFPVPDILAYKGNPEFTITNTAGGIGDAIYLNQSAGIFADKALRTAVLNGVDRTSIVATAWGGMTTAQPGMFPDKCFPPELAPMPTKIDPQALKTMVAALPSKKLDLACAVDGGAPRQQMAELLQSQLSDAGFDVSLRVMPLAEQFDLTNQPPERRPDMMIAWLGGDTFHLDTTFRIAARTGAAPVNFFQYSNPELDRLMDEAILQPNEALRNEVYRRCTQLVVDDAIWIPLCVPPSTTIAHKNVTGFVSESFIPMTLQLQDLKRT